MDSFSALIRTASHEQHVEAESSAFMTDLLGGRLGVDAYARYTEQLWFVYEALESGADGPASDRVAGPFVRPELFRLAALERDLEHLRGPGWRSTLTALPATRVYADRVATVARDWLPDTSRTTTPATWATCRAVRSSATGRSAPGVSPGRATASASTSSTRSPTRPPSSGSTAPCWTRSRWTTWRSSAWWPSASGRSP